jgi:hypothetical protein
MIKVTNNILVILFVILLGQDVVQGYFVDETKDKNKIDIFIEHSNVSGPSIFSILLPDKAAQIGGFEFNTNIMSEKAIFFSFIDKIPIPEVVFLPNDQLEIQEFNVDNLFYANLRLARLMDEYDGLKKRSQTVFEGLDVPYLNYYTDSDTTISDNNINLGAKLTMLNSDKQNIGSSVSSQNDLNRKESNPVFKLNQIQRKNLENKIFYKKKYHQINNPSSPRKFISNGDQPNKNIQVDDSQKINYGVNKNDKMVWPFPLLISVYEYSTKNKIETIIYLIISVLIINIIIRSFKHGK